MADAGVAHQNIHIFDGGKSFPDSVAVSHIAADGGGAGLFGNGFGGCVVLFVQEIDPVAPGGKGLHGPGADAPASAGDHNCFHNSLRAR